MLLGVAVALGVAVMEGVALGVAVGVALVEAEAPALREGAGEVVQQAVGEHVPSEDGEGEAAMQAKAPQLAELFDVGEVGEVETLRIETLRNTMGEDDNVEHGESKAQILKKGETPV